RALRANLAGWRLGLNVLKAVLPHRPGHVSPMAATMTFSPDGRTILTGSADHTARLWDTATGRPLGTPLRHEGVVAGVASSPHGRTIRSGGVDQTAPFWGAATGRPLGPVLKHESIVHFSAFGPDGQTALTVGNGYQGEVRLWEVPSGKPLGPAEQPHRF